jgi:hypothetical protein
MKRKLISILVGISVALLSVIGLPAYAGGGHGGGGHGGFSGGGYAGFSGGGRGGVAGRGYSGAGISRGTGSYSGRQYSSGMSTGRYGSYGGYGQRSYAPRSTTGGQVYGSSARSQSRTASRQFARSPRYSGSYYVPRDQSGIGVARKSGIQPRSGTTARAATRPDRAWSRQNAANRQRLDPQSAQRMRNWQGKAPGYADAKRNHQEHWQNRHHHDHDWWRHHCDAIVFVGGGFWGWYDGWWYPAWGYDPYYSYYDYNGPIYGYDELQPDEIIANIQAALQQLGYYPYAVDGVLGPQTEAAIADYQRNYGLSVTGSIDQSTVRSLGLGN